MNTLHLQDSQYETYEHQLLYFPLCFNMRKDVIILRQTKLRKYIIKRNEKQ
jgi:hypothetical protein